MERTYRKSSTYTHADLVKAYKAAIDKTMSINMAATAFGVPKSTLKDKVNGKSPILIEPIRTVLTTAEENEVRKCLF